MADREPVAVFVDYENLRISLRNNFKEIVKPAQLARAIRDIADECGQFREGVVYADWGERRDDARAFEEVSIKPETVLRKRSGGDRVDLVMALDALEYIKDRKDINVFLIASGDADFQEVIRRATAEGKQVRVCGVTMTTASGIISASTDFIALENRLSLTPINEDISLGTPTQDWAPFIRLVDQIEKTHNFVGVKLFRDKILISLVSDQLEPNDRQSIINTASSEGIIEIYKKENPSKREYPTAALKLNRQHPLVKNTLENGFNK